MTSEFAAQVFNVAAVVFVWLLGIAIVVIAVLWIIDITQKEHAVRRNYPVIGRFRYLFEHLGEFFRQYFFAMDREELPFNRAERSWVYQAAKGIDTTVAFGSTRDLRPIGSFLFVNCPYPTLEEDHVDPTAVTLGPYCRTPYGTSSVYHVSAMSFGAISKPAVLALSQGAKKAGIWMNTGEGGLSPWHLEGGCDIVFQIGTAKYGVRDAAGNLSDERLREVAAHETVRMFEIKLSQGAKPGKGGILPGAKVTEEIAKIRFIEPGQDSLSPNRHPDVDSAGDLLDLIDRVREVTGKPTGFKSVIGAYGWLDELFEEIKARGVESAPDFITIDSGDGGTGAAPQSLIDYMGLPIKESLPLVVDMLERHGLRDRIKVIASGKMINPGPSPGPCARAPISWPRPEGSCLRWAASRRCSATRTPAPRVSPRTMRICRKAWSSPTKPSGSRATLRTCTRRSASLPIRAACPNRGGSSGFTAAWFRTTASRCPWMSFTLIRAEAHLQPRLRPGIPAG